MSRSASPTHRGFTLIELLVVIAIIAILAAILFPIFLTARASARRAACLSNIGQLARAIQTYAVDHQGRIPDWQSAASGVVWDQAIWTCVKNKRIFTCPVNQINPATHKTWLSEGKEYVRSYCLAKNVAAQLVEQAPKPSKTVLLYEKGSQPIFVVADSTGEWFDQTYGYSHATPDKFWHGEGKNFAYCDGHAAYYRYPGGPFGYDYPCFTGWSTSAYANNPGGKGYCGYADSTGAARPSGCRGLAGANLPR